MKWILTNIDNDQEPLVGGFDFTLDEIREMQENVKEITSAIAKGISFDKVAIKLYGGIASVSAGDTILSVTPGAIWYDNEVYIIRTNDTTLDIPTPINIIENTYAWELAKDADTPRLFLNNTTNNIRQFRRAALVDLPKSWTSPILYYKDVKSVNEAFFALNTPTESDMIAGIATDKVVNPALLGRQGSDFTITYPNTVTDITTYQADRRVDGYRTSFFIDAVFTVGGTSQKYIELVLPFPIVTYGAVGGTFNLACTEKKSGFWESYITLIGVMTNQGSTTTLRLSKPFNGNSLTADTSPDPNPLFTSGVSYRFCFNFSR